MSASMLPDDSCGAVLVFAPNWSVLLLEVADLTIVKATMATDKPRAIRTGFLRNCGLIFSVLFLGVFESFFVLFA